MNFDYSPDSADLTEQARRLLAGRMPPSRLHQYVDGEVRVDRELWTTIAQLGWAGPQVPEEYGGAGGTDEFVCALSEAIGASLAPIPHLATTVLAVEAIRRVGTSQQQQELLPGLVSGSTIGTAAIHDASGRDAARCTGGRLFGRKNVVIDAMSAEVCVVPALDDVGQRALFVVRLSSVDVHRGRQPTLDLLRDYGWIEFAGASAVRLGTDDAYTGDSTIEDWLDRVAVFVAFEQLGGAQACLDAAVGYARERSAFGRSIGSFQAIKHKLADVYVAIELARSNCYFAAAQLAGDGTSLRVAAATAHFAASAAYELAARESIHTHGGFGFTWQAPCHLYHRRAKALALALGSAAYWRDRLVDGLVAQAA